MVNRLYHRYSIPHFLDNVKFLSTLVGNGVLGAYDGNAGYCSEKGGNVLYCSMGSEHYVSHAGIGFEGFIYIMFYCSILLLRVTRLRVLESLCTMRGGSLEEAKNISALLISRTIEQYPKKSRKPLLGLA